LAADLDVEELGVVEARQRALDLELAALDLELAATRA
jgi:hypothetical protein